MKDRRWCRWVAFSDSLGSLLLYSRDSSDSEKSKESIKSSDCLTSLKSLESSKAAIFTRSPFNWLRWLEGTTLAKACNEILTNVTFHQACVRFKPKKAPGGRWPKGGTYWVVLSGTQRCALSRLRRNTGESGQVSQSQRGPKTVAGMPLLLQPQWSGHNGKFLLFEKAHRPQQNARRLRFTQSVPELKCYPWHQWQPWHHGTNNTYMACHLITAQLIQTTEETPDSKVINSVLSQSVLYNLSNLQLWFSVTKLRPALATWVMQCNHTTREVLKKYYEKSYL